MYASSSPVTAVRVPEAFEALEHRLGFERLLADLSARFANVSAETLTAEIEGAQRKLMVYLGFDRCTFGEFSADGTSAVTLASVAVAGVESMPPGPFPDLPWYLSELRAGRIVALRSLPGDLPPEAVHEREDVMRSGIKAHLGIPLSIGGRVCAAIGMASFGEPRIWPDMLAARLMLVGEVFAQALHRTRVDAEMRRALDEIRRLKDRLEAENDYLRKSTLVQAPRDLASRSPRFRRLVDDLQRVAATSATVLLQGETGTGKEVLAEAIHQLSPRRQQPMVRVNCAALPAALIEAELFGREKGAYTGALARQMGRFELADASTILLDEVGELPLELQAKLLRVLENGEFERVGGTRTIRVDVRIIAATNRDLEQAVADGQFRRDLYYRLNVFPIDVPPLRERREDIQTLAWTFIKEFGEAMGKRIERVDEDSLHALETYAWPGNVRELRNVIERAMILATGPVLRVALARSAVATITVSAGTLEDAERAHIVAALAQTGWRVRGVSGAAMLLDIKPTTLESRMQRLGIRRPD
jgi:formate hydrogenlyase transcriptional activator